MFRREMAIQRRSFAVWTAVLLALFVGITVGYPLLIDEKLYATIDQFMGVFPSGLLKAFNMDIASISKASGWIKSEGLILYELAGALYAAILGGTILVKEESDRTIEFACSLPVSRERIALSRYLAGFVYVLLMPALVTGATCLALRFTEGLEWTEMAPLLLSPALPFAAAYSIAFAVSTLFRRTRSMTALGFLLVLGSYVLYLTGQLSEKAAPLKRFSLFAICDVREIVLGGSIPFRSYAVAGAIALGSLLFALLAYRRKNLV